MVQDRQTFVHKAKNKEICLCTSGNDMVETLWTNGCAPFMESFSQFPVSETWEQLTDTSWLTTYKIFIRKKNVLVLELLLINYPFFPKFSAVLNRGILSSCTKRTI